MNHNIEKLYQIALKPVRHIIGLMSGTSMDGLDVAFCRIEGHGEDTKVQLLHFETVPYTEGVKSEIRKIFALQNIDFQHLTLLNAWIGRLHGEMILACLKKWKVDTEGVDIIASHGQTVFHAPKILHGIERFPNATLQIGDGDHIAVTTNIITLSDFRQKHVAAGGEGAPLAVYGDYYIFSKKGENRILLNMGGIANFTYLPASTDATEVFVTDTGPGNTLLDATIRQFFPEKAYDDDATVAKQGKIIPQLLKALKDNDFFEKPFPKTTGPELFNIQYVDNAIQCGKLKNPSVYDLMATLTRFSAETIADAILKLFKEKEFDKDIMQQFTIYMSGGGMHNPLIVKHLKEILPDLTFKKTNDLGINGDAKEAILFAILANETVAGGKTQFGNRAGIPNVTMGKISFPS
jgi:anhydro-N-acetylmuramic acid kinase